MLASVLAVDLNFRGNDVDSAQINKVQVEVSSIKLSLTVNDESTFRPTNLARGSLQLTTSNGDRLSFNFKGSEILSDSGGVAVFFEDVKVSYTERTQVCKKNRCSIKNVRTKAIESVMVVVDYNTKTVRLYSNGNIPFNLEGISGNVVNCVKVSGRTECSTTSY
jgi:hypothetical protein